MEISSGYLKQRKLEPQLNFIIEFLAARSTSAKYMYGWACDLRIDEHWKTYPVEICEIKAKVKESIEKRIFKCGDSDFYIHDGEERFYFILCHEGDVHFSSDNEELVSQVREYWRHKGYETHEIGRRV